MKATILERIRPLPHLGASRTSAPHAIAYADGSIRYAMTLAGLALTEINDPDRENEEGARIARQAGMPDVYMSGAPYRLIEGDVPTDYGYPTYEAAYRAVWPA